MFRFHPDELHDNEVENDIVRALPRSHQNPCGQFDTVVAYVDKALVESTGISGRKDK